MPTSTKEKPSHAKTKVAPDHGKTEQPVIPPPEVFYTGSTIDEITRGVTLVPEPDFGEIYKVPARGKIGGGRPFELRRTGRKVKRLQLWSNLNALRGVQVTFEDGATMQAGKLEQESRGIDFHPDETITSTIIASNSYDGGRAAAVELRTDFGQAYVGVFPTIPNFPIGPRRTPYTDVTRGTLVGVYGGEGSDLDNLGLILALAEDSTYEYRNVRYDTSQFKGVGDRLLSLKDGVILNPSDGTVTTALLFSHTYTATKTWSNTIGLKLGVKTTIQTGIPFLVEGKVEFSFEASYSYTWGESVSDQKTDSWTVTVAAPPHTNVRVMATVTESTIDVPFSADLIIRRSDGSTKTVSNFSGVYRGVNVSRMLVKAENIPTGSPTE